MRDLGITLELATVADELTGHLARRLALGIEEGAGALPA